MKIMVEIPDNEIRKKFKINQKAKIKEFKKSIRKYITDYNPKLKFLCDTIDEDIDRYLKM